MAAKSLDVQSDLEPQLFIVADSNFYRGLSPERIARIAALESAQSVIPLAGFWPSIELLSHLANPASKNFPAALSAAKKLATHCGYTANGQRRLRVMEDGELQLCRGLYGVTLLARFTEIEILTALLGKIDGFPAAYTNSDIQSIQDLADRVEKREAAFAEAMKSSTALIREIVEGGGAEDLAGARAEFLRALSEPARRRLTASSIATQAAVRAKLDPQAVVTPQAIDTLLLGFPVSVEFFIGLMRTAGESEVNWDKPQNRNSMWDWLISFHAAPHVEVNNRPLLLVSSDSRLRKAASDVRRNSWVVGVDEYEVLLAESRIDNHVQLMTKQRYNPI